MEPQQNKSFIIFVIFFLSGASALIYEGIWFHFVGLIVGNSVIATATVLSGFMAGLALGNYLMVRYGPSMRKPIVIYLILEILIGCFGLISVLLLPAMPALLAPLYSVTVDNPLFHNPLRFLTVFLILFIPTTAMGMTLPLMVKHLMHINRSFGQSLGRLYGWNTLGAVVGILVAEFYLIRYIGLQRTGFIAALINFVIAYLIFSRIKTDHFLNHAIDELKHSSVEYKQPVLLLMTIAFISGFLLLSLEIVWFRFLLLTISGTGEIFAIMLACVLAGIGVGGLFAGKLLNVSGLEKILLPTLLGFSALSCLTTYLLFSQYHSFFIELITNGVASFTCSALLLILPNAILSGMIFTVTGKLVHNIVLYESIATGLLTLANTFGAMLGAILTSLFLLPLLGMEKTFWLAGIIYLCLVLFVPDHITKPFFKTDKALSFLPALGALLLVVFFPFGHMYNKHYLNVADKWRADNIVAVSEGRVATNMYFAYERFGHPYYYRLITNSYSMSGTGYGSERYMKLFAYWPAFVRDDLEQALLISYGVGVTAKALTNLSSLNHIDIVDISADALALSKNLYANKDEHPLQDKRVSTHIKDGRHYLLTTNKQYDLITGEPPPPGLHKIVNLYSQEYFELVYKKLKPGGISTYWLPVYQIGHESNKSIIKAFCNVFSDCSLWRSSGLEWMLVGSKNSNWKLEANKLADLYQNPVVSQDLINLALEKPEQILATFLADSEQLADITERSKPIIDNYPKRINQPLSLDMDAIFYDELMNQKKVLDRFQSSRFLTERISHNVKNNSIGYFNLERMFTSVALPKSRRKEEYYFEDLYQLLTETDLTTLPLVLLGSDYKEQHIVKKVLGAEHPNDRSIFLPAAIERITNRDYQTALHYLDIFISETNQTPNANLHALYVLVLCLDKRKEQALEYIHNHQSVFTTQTELRTFTNWLESKLLLN